MARLRLEKRYIPFIDIRDDLEGSLDAIILDLASLNCSNKVLARKPQDVECVFAGKRDQFPALRPVDLGTC